MRRRAESISAQGWAICLGIKEEKRAQIIGKPRSRLLREVQDESVNYLTVWIFMGDRFDLHSGHADIRKMNEMPYVSFSSTPQQDSVGPSLALPTTRDNIGTCPHIEFYEKHPDDGKFLYHTYEPGVNSWAVHTGKQIKPRYSGAKCPRSVPLWRVLPTHVQEYLDTEFSGGNLRQLSRPEIVRLLDGGAVRQLDDSQGCC